MSRNTTSSPVDQWRWFRSENRDGSDYRNSVAVAYAHGMGLRDRQAAHTRETILDAAFALFGEYGYQRTTMEDIAAASDVGTTTLYRYFPTKDTLIVGPLALHGQMADELRSRPTDEPLGLALGHAIAALARAPRAGADRLAQIQRLLDATPSLATRLYEEFINERALLQAAVAERTGRDGDSLFCRSTAHLAAVVVELVDLGVSDGARGSNSGSGGSAVDALTSVLRQLSADPPVLPRL